MATQFSQSLPGGGRREVTVFVDPQEPQAQPENFHICPLGVQFYSPRALEDFTILELDIEVPTDHGKSERIACTGAVVRCQLDKTAGKYRVWVKFLDLPAGTSERIRCASKNGQHLCSYCENF